MTTVVVVQSNYLPWKGYFDLVHDTDLFVFYDDVQYSNGSWRNRNRIRTAQGVKWLTVPVGTSIDRLICEVEIEDSSWQRRHWATLQQAYSRSPHFARYAELFRDVYLGRTWRSLSDLNQFLVRTIAHDLLGIRTRFADSREYAPVGRNLDRLLDLIARTGASRYVSGPSARSYIEPSRFADAGIELVWKDYAGYPEYPQGEPPFVHDVSIVDLLFNVGPDAPWYIWGWRDPSMPRPMR